MSTDTAVKTQVPADPRTLRPARLVLLIVAIIEVVGSLTSLVILFDGDPSVPGTSPGGFVITATILLAPPVAIAALALAISGPLGATIISIALLGLLDWVSFVPSVANFWGEFPGSGFGGAHTIVQTIVLPLLGIAAIVLAWRGERLRLAATFAILPTLLNFLGVVAFAIGVAIYGF